MRHSKEAVPRRAILELGAAGAALLFVPEACSSSTSGGALDGSVDAPRDGATVMDGSPREAASSCKTDFVDAGGSCSQSDRTAAVNILKAGIDQPGTSYEFSDCRFMDRTCNDDRIILIHGTNTDGYVALQGACPNECCDNTMESGGPAYYAVCTVSTDSCSPAGFTCNVDAGAPPDAGPPPDTGVDAAADSEPDADADAEASSDAMLIGEGGPDAGQVLTDILVCSCCGSIFDASSGAVIHGPSKFGLQKLETCEGSGWVFITLP
jgi:hypothetical protein